ncbi:NAD(P)/FAD-dependent oxidoreductase [Weissella diestrammenae]|uniref:Ferredoxin--NADP reductase n=1 Tax=Weissella diestrammenae TaxID=1162633 RepID=A0A7G9T6K2_9LACO|nr:NAD(P)/FAD-dependent oxidoreductase [Weissella diestrammenae]MCM0582995.1 NAD(P)/FAD-dependent oxidoreductase [Weissella diestrammenae]QNN75727.1 NAD(P)/FAD-dependent oxidoreductase [Weissella diestrammenae]
MTEIKQTDLIIIGGGPVGMFAAFYAGLRELDVTLIESLKTLGGQTANLYPQKQILDIPGFLAITGQDLISQLSAQMNQFQQNIMLETTVIDVATNDQGFLITTDHQEQLQAKAILIATGKGAFNPRRLAPEIEQDFEGQGLNYFVSDLNDFQDKRVLVAGGGDSAVDLALLLNTVASEVHILHRREQFRAMEHAVTALNQSTVQQETPYQISELTRNPAGDFKVTLSMPRAQAIKTIEVDELVISYGFLSENKIVSSWQIQPESMRQKFVVDQTMQTTIPGVYAVGDIAGYPNKAELIATGFGEVPVAINTMIANQFPTHQGVVHSSGLTIKDGKIEG